MINDLRDEFIKNKKDWASRRPHSLVRNHLDLVARQMSGLLEMETAAVDDDSPLNHDGFLRRVRRCTVFTCVIGRQALNQREFEIRQRFV